jgi:gamma-glutamylcyclotransferase (GGCT)/AIG2-like uncharacterized protein YtfP
VRVSQELFPSVREYAKSNFPDELLEGHPDDYRREKIWVVTNLGRHYWAWAYFYPEARGRLLTSGCCDSDDTS